MKKIGNPPFPVPAEIRGPTLWPGTMKGAPGPATPGPPQGARTQGPLWEMTLLI